jgi:very-short-patch-repair endonuclease
MQVVSPIRAICDLYGTETPESILSAINSCLVQRLFTKKQLGAELQRRPKMRGRACIERLLEFATAGCESPLESLGWAKIYKAQFVMPRQQVGIKIGNGINGNVRVDMYWELPGRKIVLEVDGRQKYKDDDEAYYNEKVRHDKLSNLGYEIIRASWKQTANGYLTQLLADRGIPKRRYFGLKFPGFNK